MTSTHLSLPARLVTSPLSAPLAFLGGSFCRLADRYFLKQGFWETDPESPGEFQIPGTHVREGTIAHQFQCYGVPQSLNIQYFERMAEGARVCYIAGLGSNGRIDDAFLDALHAKGLATYALNLPDAGESGGMRNHEGQAFAWSDIKANPREYSQGILRPLIATLNAINHDGRDLYLVGHSLGAGTVLGLAASGKVRGLKGVIPLCVASSDGEAAHVHWYIRSIAALATDAGASYGRRFIKWISGIRNLHDRNFVPTSFALSLTLLATHFVVSHFTSQSFSRKAAKRMTAASILPHWIDPTRSPTHAFHVANAGAECAISCASACRRGRSCRNASDRSGCS
jgi:pimeloyl-ACP methyl ester carboxylesterase